MSEERSQDPQREILAKRHPKSSSFVRIYRHTSLKTGKRHSGEGHNERDFWLWCDSRTEIRNYATELDSVHWERGRRYTPDAALLYQDNRLEYAEIKSDRTACSPKFLANFRPKVEAFHAAGQTLRLVPRSEMPSKTYIDNLKRLYMYKTGARPWQDELEAFSSLLGVGESREFGELVDELGTRQMTCHPIWYGLATETLTTDLNKPISTYSTITRRK